MQQFDTVPIEPLGPSPEGSRISIVSLQQSHLDYLLLQPGRVEPDSRKETFTLDFPWDQEFGERLKRCLVNREYGALVFRAPQRIDKEQMLPLLLSISRLFGPLIPDVGSDGRAWRRVSASWDPSRTVQDSSFHINPFLTFPLHTDGVFHTTPPDWLALAMTEDNSAGGGRSLLLHVDDWEERDLHRENPLAQEAVTWLTPVKVQQAEHSVFASPMNALNPRARVFDEMQDGVCIRYFMRERGAAAGPGVQASPEQLDFLYGIGQSLWRSSRITSVALRPGDILFANNRFMLHGREKFQTSHQFRREVIRVRGRFA